MNSSGTSVCSSVQDFLNSIRKKNDFEIFSTFFTDVIEILSSDEDVKVLSEGEKDEQSDLEYGISGQEEESGTHTDDSKNCPDSLGRVLVNVNHPIDEQDIFLPQHLAEKVKPHQVSVCCT